MTPNDAEDGASVSRCVGRPKGRDATLTGPAEGLEAERHDIRRLERHLLVSKMRDRKWITGIEGGRMTHEKEPEVAWVVDGGGGGVGIIGGWEWAVGGLAGATFAPDDRFAAWSISGWGCCLGIDRADGEQASRATGAR